LQQSILTPNGTIFIGFTKLIKQLHFATSFTENAAATSSIEQQPAAHAE
jgi:hypothetical protein